MAYATESEVDLFELHRQIVEATDATQRAYAIARVRSLIEEERRAFLSAEDSAYLEVAAMIVDFLADAPIHART